MVLAVRVAKFEILGVLWVYDYAAFPYIDSLPKKIFHIVHVMLKHIFQKKKKKLNIFSIFPSYILKKLKRKKVFTTWYIKPLPNKKKTLKKPAAKIWKKALWLLNDTIYIGIQNLLNITLIFMSYPTTGFEILQREAEKKKKKKFIHFISAILSSTQHTFYVIKG